MIIPNAMEKLKDVKTFFLDMDGTFYLENTVLEGSMDFLHALADTGKQALFLTNNSSKSTSVYMRKLKKMGVPKAFCEVLTSGKAAGHYVLSNYEGKSAYVLGTPAFKREIIQLGITIDETNPDIILMGYDTTLNYRKLTEVCDWVRSGIPYIATHPDFNCPMEKGYAPDIGAQIAYIDASTQRKPDLIIGKPHAGILEQALALTGRTKEEVAMVGDRLYTDIAMGKNFGLLSVLVLTGEACVADIASSGIVPDIIVERLSSMIPHLS